MGLVARSLCSRQELPAGNFGFATTACGLEGTAAGQGSLLRTESFGCCGDSGRDGSARL
jgi:hypothetical protein